MNEIERVGLRQEPLVKVYVGSTFSSTEPWVQRFPAPSGGKYHAAVERFSWGWGPPLPRVLARAGHATFFFSLHLGTGDPVPVPRDSELSMPLDEDR